MHITCDRINFVSLNTDHRGVVELLLEMILNGDVTAVAALNDYLSDHSLPFAAAVNCLFEYWIESIRDIARARRSWGVGLWGVEWFTNAHVELCERTVGLFMACGTRLSVTSAVCRNDVNDRYVHGLVVDLIPEAAELPDVTAN